MASFKTHISLGIILGIIAIVLVLFYVSFKGSILFNTLLFLVVVLGSLLPDFDSDEGTLFQMVFGLAAVVSAAVTLIYYYKQEPHSLGVLIGAPLAAFVFVRFILGTIFKKFTHHRGIFHSLPMLGVVMLGSILIFNQLNLLSREKILLSGALGLGFLGHLLLDELKSATRFKGIFLIPRRSLGSALKLVAPSKISTIIVYTVLLVLVYFNLPVFRQLF